jgi:hypothetical protein
MDQLTSVSKQNIEREEDPREAIKQHPQIRNAVIFNQEFISRKKGKAIDLDSVLLFEMATPFINFWCHHADSIPISP